MYKIRLYISGQTPRSMRASEALKAILEVNYKDQYCLKIIDLTKNPGIAEEDGIIATPTAVRLIPQPARRIVGDFSNSEKVLAGLGLLDEEGGLLRSNTKKNLIS